MSNLDEAFLTPLRNNYGVYKPLTGNHSHDFPQIIADLMERMFRCPFSSEIEQRYDSCLNDEDYHNYRKIAFSKYGIHRSFETNLVHHLKEKRFNVVRVTVPSSKFDASYYELEDDYEKRVIGIGPYRYPVWLLDDE